MEKKKKGDTDPSDEDIKADKANDPHTGKADDELSRPEPIPYQFPIEDDPVWMVAEASMGVEASVVNDIIDISGLSQQRVAEDYFNLSYKTLSRYIKNSKRLNPRDSETALMLLRLFQKGTAIMASNASFTSWLGKPAYGLGGRLPADLLITHAGIELVMDELYRIEYGALA